MTENTTVLLLDGDLFFVSRIREGLKTAGCAVQVARSAGDLRARLAGEMQFIAVLVHIGVVGVDWQGAIVAARSAAVPVLAYGAHVDSEAQAEARAAGATRVIGNSKLAGNIVAQVDQTIARATRIAEPTVETDDDL